MKSFLNKARTRCKYLFPEVADLGPIVKSVPTDLSARVLTTSLPYFDRRLKGAVSVGLNFEKHK